jgi:hypothetical protein
MAGLRPQTKPSDGFALARAISVGWTVRDSAGPSSFRPPEEITAEQEAALVEKPLHAIRLMARNQGVSPATVQRIWQKHHLQPHRVEFCKFSTDPQFVTKVTQPS